MKKCDKCWGTGMPIDHEQVGLEAYRARVDRCEGLEKAAGRMGISVSYLSLLESGKRTWTRELYERAIQKG